MSPNPPSESVPREEWSRALDAFTRSHAGREAVLEIDDPEVGAQRIADAPLWGVVYDDRDDEVQILFGDFERGRTRLVHAVRGPTALEVHPGPDARSAVLRVAWAEGQALLHVASRP